VPNADWITQRPIAHRGFHDMNDRVWENTQSAFNLAIRFGFAIECDLQMSSDGVPMVFHDYVLDRLCGVEGQVRHKSAAELTELHVGQTGDTIPTFDQFLGRVAGRTGVVAELKPQTRTDTEIFAEAVASHLADYSGPLALMSFDHDLVRTLIDLDTGLPIGLTAMEANDEQARHNEEARSMPIDFVSFHVADLPSAFIKRSRADGVPVITWTVRDAEAVEITKQYADQMTFEGFNPNDLRR